MKVIIVNSTTMW